MRSETKYDPDLKHSETLRPVFRDEASDKWNPTGVYEYDGKVYAANYTDHDILKGRIEGSEYKIEELIVNQAMKARKTSLSQLWASRLRTTTRMQSIFQP